MAGSLFVLPPSTGEEWHAALTLGFLTTWNFFADTSCSSFLRFAWAFSFSFTALVQTWGYRNEKYPPFWKGQPCNLQTSISTLASCTPSSCLNIPWKACKLGDQRVHEDETVQNHSFDQVQSCDEVINKECIFAW